MSKHPVVPGRHVLVITQVNPYTAIGGVGTILRNLFSVFSAESYTFAYLGRFESRWRKESKRPDCYRLIPNWHPVQFLDIPLKGIKESHAIRRAVQVGRERNADIVVGLYPTYRSLSVASQVAEELSAEFYPYLHDTLVEGLSHSPMAKDAVRLQERIFAQASEFIVINQGMSDFYKSKYGRDNFLLQMSFPEKIASTPNLNRTKTAFWGGDVYKINDKSLHRLQKALLIRSTLLELTCLADLGFDDKSNVRQYYYPTRREYIEALQRHGMMLLAINWPDESEIHSDELSTIWPTKAVEYLATGSPIVVHCPEEYFLARFFRQHRCGVVVTERRPEALLDAVDRIQAGGSEIVEMQHNALALTDFFSTSAVAAKLQVCLSGERGVEGAKT